MVAIFVGGILGTALGLISGYFGGRTDSLIMRLVDISLSFPTILVALVLVAAVGPSFSTVIIVVVVFLWARYARLVRGETLRSRNAISSPGLG
jgi:peptide/nickel transport system permease protein